MRSLSMREANQKFSSCVAAVEKGERFVINRRGKPVAELIPFQKAADSARRNEAIREMMAILERGIPMGTQAPTRDEMHER